MDKDKWNLSMEIKQHDSITCDKYYSDYAVKEFIRRLKELQGEWTEEMNKLAGEKFAE